MGMLTSPEMRADVVNFVNDGTLPNINTGDLKTSLKNGLSIMEAGMRIMNENGIEVQDRTTNLYKLFTSLYLFVNQR